MPAPLAALAIAVAAAIGLVLAGGGTHAGRAGGHAAAGGLGTRPPRDVRVVRAVDGDTVVVAAEDGRTDVVRYIGIDTPESVKPGTPVQCFAKAASHANARLVAGQRVRLVLDAEHRDRYGRLLAYVFRAADGLFVNDVLVRRGYARTLPFPPNTHFASRFAALQDEARSGRRGLWGRC